MKLKKKINVKKCEMKVIINHSSEISPAFDPGKQWAAHRVTYFGDMCLGHGHFS